ncbi:MAG: FAD-binding oxidoreductase [Solirubrobacterales bacterium]
MTVTVTEPWKPIKWWGWGDPTRHDELAPAAMEMLRSGLGVDGRKSVPVRLEAVRTPPSRLAAPIKQGLLEVVGDNAVRDDQGTRVVHAAGKGYPDLVRMRTGDGEGAPDAVVYPATAIEVWRVLEFCSRQRVAVVPFGGGTSVVGGVEPIRGSCAAVVSLDLARMIAVTNVDERSLTVTLGPGLRGPQAESALAQKGLTLGHFPQSFEYATVGGWVATRSAGQASTGYGRIDDLVSGLRCVTPSGEIVLPPRPGTAAGPDVVELLVGSEGVFGVITEVTLRVRRLPEARHYEGWSFASFDQGAEALRHLEQGPIALDVARLSDEAETQLGAAISGTPAAGACLAILGFEGAPDDVERRRAQASEVVRTAGGTPLGEAPGIAWEKRRFEGPYLRDTLMDHGVMVETLETAAPWSGLMRLYEAVRSAISSTLELRGTPGIVMCHISHLYPDGASLYFSFAARQQPGMELQQWQAVKSAATDAIVGAGGTITHHHAVGRDHAPWLAHEIGPASVEALRAMKARLDPAGIMNPGKLLPPIVGASV